jgi:hypothetical protein
MIRMRLKARVRLNASLRLILRVKARVRLNASLRLILRVKARVRSMVSANVKVRVMVGMMVVIVMLRASIRFRGGG